MKILMTGSSGLIGTALVESLTHKGHTIVRLVRRNSAEGFPVWDPERGVIDLSASQDVEAVLHLAGKNIAGGRWTDSKKDAILKSRVKGTRLLAESLAALDRKPRVFITASAIGIYGERGNAPVDESSAPGHGFLSAVCQQWETASAPATAAGIRVVNLRLGAVLSAAGGALKKMLPPFRIGLGGMIGGGTQYFSWISIDDVVDSIQHILATESIRGPVNLVSPQAVTNREFTKTLGRILHRPTCLTLPAFAARILFGEMADELLLQSVRAVPQKLMDSGYTFHHPELEKALEALIRPSQPVSPSS